MTTTDRSAMHQSSPIRTEAFGWRRAVGDLGLMELAHSWTEAKRQVNRWWAYPRPQHQVAARRPGSTGRRSEKPGAVRDSLNRRNRTPGAEDWNQTTK